MYSILKVGILFFIYFISSPLQLLIGYTCRMEKELVTVGRDDVVQIYTTDMDELLQIAESRVTRQLTAEEKEKYGGLDLN